MMYQHDSEPLNIFARLVPVNRAATVAIRAASLKEDAEYHRTFIKRHKTLDDENTLCYEFSFTNLPKDPKFGWKIGCGNSKLDKEHTDVDLLLPGEGAARLHGRFLWVVGAGGFFVKSDSRPIVFNGRKLLMDQRVIPRENTIFFGECCFALVYADRAPSQERYFQVRLASFYKNTFGGTEYAILATPRESESRFGPYVLQYPVSKGTFGIVSMVTHSQTGQVFAAKQLIATRESYSAVENEIKMAEVISRFEHDHIVSPIKVYQEPTMSDIEVQRVQALLDHKWRPPQHILGYYVIILPYCSATLKSVFTSTLDQADRALLFLQILDAIKFLHSKGLCHRDIKPANIVVEQYEPPICKLVDYGSVSIRKVIEYDGPGTVPRLAPEQQEGQTHGRAVDCWAAALVGMQLIDDKECPFKDDVRIETQPDIDICHRWLDKQTSQIAPVANAMLCFRAEDRLSAGEAFTMMRNALPATATTGKRGPSDSGDDDDDD